MLIFFFSSFSATRYNLNTQKLLNLRKSYVPIVLSVTPDNFWRHRNHLFHGTQNHQNSVVSVDSAPLPWQSRIHRINLFWHFFKFSQNSKFFSSICGFCCARVGGQITQKLLKNLVAPKMYSSGNSLFFMWILWILPPYPGGAEVTDSTERGSVASVSSATQNQLFL